MQFGTTMTWVRLLAAFAVAGIATPWRSYGQDRGDPWVRHVIDDSSQGADGVRLDDVNGDGLLDIATGWEKGVVVRAYINPGFENVGDRWPAVTVGDVSNAEDAVFVDLDNDGAKDVVSSAEGGTNGVFVHWAPSDPQDYLDPAQWQTEMIPPSQGRLWMFAVPMQVDGENGIDIIAGAKDNDAKIAWFESPSSDPRDLSAWTMHAISNVAWTMSLITHDLDDDGDLDLVVTDRYNGVGLEGARWFENPGTGSPAQNDPWTGHYIGAHGKEPMLSVIADLDRDGLDDLIVPTRSVGGLSFFRRTHPVLNNWQEHPIARPADVGTPKACNVGDIDLDGDPDIVFAFANATGDLSGVVWMSYVASPTDDVWDVHEISGPEGIKFDLVALVDLDGDTDLDAITTEEKTGDDGLGVIWYENPTFDQAPVPGDFDRDGDVDQADFGHLQVCLSGAGIPQTDPNCRDADLDGDNGGDVDQVDLSIFRACMSGADVPGDPNCAD